MAVLKTTSPLPRTCAPSGCPTNARPSSSTRAAWVGAGSGMDDDRQVAAVRLLQEHLDAFGLGGGHVLADVVRPDRQLAVTAVDQHGQLDRAGPAELHE